MSIDSIVSSNALPNGSQGPSSDLGKDDFLKLMLIQMRNQDPLNPMDNQAMLSQMAQFTSLEQMSNLNDSFSSTASVQGSMHATQLLGKEIQIVDPNSPPDQPGTITSQVKSVRFSDQGPVMTLASGHVATIDQILNVAEPTEQ